MKLKYDKLLLNSAFSVNLRPSNKEAASFRAFKAGRCRLTPGGPQAERAWFQRLKLKYDEALSKIAFNLNLRRYLKGHLQADHPEATAMLSARPPHDGETLRVRWPPGDPVKRPVHLTLHQRQVGGG